MVGNKDTNRRLTKYEFACLVSFRANKLTQNNKPNIFPARSCPIDQAIAEANEGAIPECLLFCHDTKWSSKDSLLLKPSASSEHKEAQDHS